MMDPTTAIAILFAVFLFFIGYSLLAQKINPSAGSYPKNIVYEDDYQKEARLKKAQPKATPPPAPKHQPKPKPQTPPKQQRSYTPPPVVKEGIDDYCKLLGVRRKTLTETEKEYLDHVKSVYISKISAVHPDAMVNAATAIKMKAEKTAIDINRSYTYIKKYYKKS